MGNISERERSKYAEIWAYDEYHEVSPGAQLVPTFLTMTRANPPASVLDVGAGAGAASRVLKDMGFAVDAFDLTDVGWTHKDIRLVTGSIWNNLDWAERLVGPGYNYAYCCDVMEHIPTEFVALTVARVLAAGTKAFFSVSFTDDFFGHYVGQALHLTVKPFGWWLDVFRELGTVHDARDLMGEGLFLVTGK